MTQPTKSTWAARVPLLATIVGAAGLGVLALWRVLQTPLPSALWMIAAILVYVAWMSWESRISVAELDRPDSDYDRGTMELAAVAKISTLLACLIPASQQNIALAIPGLLLMIFGALFRIAAIRSLGNGYSHRIRPFVTLCTQGPYAWVRHPAYLGTWAVHLGITLVFCNLWALLSAALLWGSAVILRAFLEDRLLMQAPEYQAYARQVRYRLLPFLW